MQLFTKDQAQRALENLRDGLYKPDQGNGIAQNIVMSAKAGNFQLSDIGTDGVEMDDISVQLQQQARLSA